VDVKFQVHPVMAPVEFVTWCYAAGWQEPKDAHVDAYPKTIDMEKFLTWLFFAVFLVALLMTREGHAQGRRPNILFIAVDDLKPELGCYGSGVAKTPNIDRLAGDAAVFMQNHCQQAECGPSRASAMTGMRPDHTRVWDLRTQMRSAQPNILTIPQYLSQQGYITEGIGKIFDLGSVDADHDKSSWTVPFHKTHDKYVATGYADPVQGWYQSPAIRQLTEKYEKEAAAKGLTAAKAKEYVLQRVKPSAESADVPDNAYPDGASVLQAVDIMASLSRGERPFFLAVGLQKPHLPFVAPTKYWDLYRREQMSVSGNQDMPDLAPPMAMHHGSELRSYTDIAGGIIAAKDNGIGIPLTADRQRELLHGYYAAISYMDANVGVLLRALDSLQLREQTIIVLWGDHGWHLGDHGMWGKQSNFDQATRAPLIISAPGMRSSTPLSPTELVDVFPTLCELSGLPIPGSLQGVSLVPVMRNPATRVKEYAVSQSPRSGVVSETGRLGYIDIGIMGYSVRTERYRYTLWMKNGFRSDRPFDPSAVVGRELYDYESDPAERRNLIDNEGYVQVSEEMHGRMLEFFRTQLR
jgi:arylsulfatase A-like enzyme